MLGKKIPYYLFQKRRIDFLQTRKKEILYPKQIYTLIMKVNPLYKMQLKYLFLENDPTFWTFRQTNHDEYFKVSVSNRIK